MESRRRWTDSESVPRPAASAGSSCSRLPECRQPDGRRRGGAGARAGAARRPPRAPGARRRHRAGQAPRPRLLACAGPPGRGCRARGFSRLHDVHLDARLSRCRVWPSPAAGASHWPPAGPSARRQPSAPTRWRRRGRRWIPRRAPAGCARWPLLVGGCRGCRLSARRSRSQPAISDRRRYGIRGQNVLIAQISRCERGTVVHVGRFTADFLARLRVDPNVAAAGREHGALQRISRISPRSTPGGAGEGKTAKVRACAPDHARRGSAGLCPRGPFLTPGRAARSVSAIVNQEFVRRHFAGVNPVGRTLTRGYAPVTSDVGRRNTPRMGPTRRPCRDDSSHVRPLTELRARCRRADRRRRAAPRSAMPSAPSPSMVVGTTGRGRSAACIFRSTAVCGRDCGIRECRASFCRACCSGCCAVARRREERARSVPISDPFAGPPRWPGGDGRRSRGGLIAYQRWRNCQGRLLGIAP